MNQVLDSQIVADSEDTVLVDAPDHVPGGIAIWILIFAELFEFGMFFILYIVAKVHNPELFHVGPPRLNTYAGILNTAILLTSSFFIAKAVRAIRLDRVVESRRWIWLTLFSGLAYCLVKMWEYHFNELNGITVNTDLFFSVYYYLTFNHLLHVFFGMAGLIFVLVRSYFNAYSAQEYNGLEAGASYWHMVDLAWIIIFPLIYVMR